MTRGVMMLTTSLPGRYWAKVDRTGDCWLWTASTRKGYGRFMLDGKVRTAHRLAYEDAFGPVPDGLTLDHLCRVRNCVRPDHLEPCTKAANSYRAPDYVGNRQECINGHAYTKENTLMDRGSRRCRRCHRDREAVRRAATAARRAATVTA